MVLLAAVILLVQIVNFAAWSTSKTSHDSNDVLEENLKEREFGTIFVARQKRIREVCLNEGRSPPSTVAESKFPRKTVVDANHNILYCAIQKVASTFLTDILITINSNGKFKSPFLVEHNKKTNSLVEKYEDFQKSRSESVKALFMKDAVSLLVVRDPYTRLFSAYADKIYHPNHYFWRTTGKTIENMLKRQSVYRCGNTISFADFIKYIIREFKKTVHELDPHFTPIYMHCDPCISKYNYIMAFENLKDELFYISNTWNTKFNLNLTLSFADFELETASRIAKEHISMSFLTMKRYSRICNIAPYNFLLRTWRFLQISGLLPKTVDIPFPDNEHASLVTKGMFLDEVKMVLSQDIDWVQLKTQRQEALEQAYQDVDIADIEALVQIMKKDCAYFGYDATPGYLFRRAYRSFNYFDGVKLQSIKSLK